MYIYTSPYVRTRDQVVYRKIECIVPKLLEPSGSVRYGAKYRLMASDRPLGPEGKAGSDKRLF
jgi:hypothetical protein